MTNLLLALALLWCSITSADCFILINDTEALLFRGNDSSVSGPDQYLRVMHVEEHFVLIGARNNFYNVSTQTMAVTETFKWIPLPDDQKFCQAEISKFGGDCNSYVRTVIKVSDEWFDICASSAKVPMCRTLKLVNGKWILSVAPAAGVPKKTMTPVLPWNEIKMLTTKTSKTLYVAGHEYLSGTVWRPYLYRRANTVNGKEVGGLRTVQSNNIFQIDYQHGKATEFKHIFETDDYVYITFTEPAQETFYGTERKSYARIARVCKNDLGRGESPAKDFEKFLFATLFKTRLLCGDAGSTVSGSDLQSHYKMKLKGYYTSYVDELVDATAPHMSSVKDADGEDIILAVFNSPRGDIQSSAICAYKISDIDRIFDTSSQIKFTSAHASFHKTTRPAAKCYADSRNMNASERLNLENYLLSEPVRPIENHTLFMSAVDFRMTQMAVDWQVEALDGNKYDVIFVSTDDGRLIKMIEFVKEGETEKKYHTVEVREIFPGQAIQEMQLIRDSYGKKHLLINSFGQVKRVAIEKCHLYLDCAFCLAERDPYCSWSPSMDKCVSTTHQANDKHQNITSGRSEVCHKDVPNVDNEKTTARILTIPSISVGNTGASRDNQNKKDLSLLALLAIIPVGMACFFAGYWVSKRKHMSRTPHIDQELTNKCKSDTLNSNSDAYQALPKHSNHLQLTNNFNGKAVPNIDPGMNTLTRQKKVYV